MWTIDALPLHPMLVHAPVVLAPLVAVGLCLFAIWPTGRRVVGPLLLALALGSALTSIMAVETGEQLVDALGRGSTADRHADRGRMVRNLVVGVAIATALAVALDRSDDSGTRRWSQPVAAATAVAALISMAFVALAGHSGAELAWAGRIPEPVHPSNEQAPADQDDSDPPERDDRSDTATSADRESDEQPSTASDSSTPTRQPSENGPDAPAAVETIPGMVDIVLGEWAIVTSVDEAPPGPVTFRIRNAGQIVHSLRIRTPGSGGDRLEWRSPEVEPGGELTWTVELAVGSYELTCPIEGSDGEHDELGMRGGFTIREGAPVPLAPQRDQSSTSPEDAGATDREDQTEAPRQDPTTADLDSDPSAGLIEPPSEPVTIDIEAFAFNQRVIEIPVGTEVTWINRDPAPHTATGASFDTGILGQGDAVTIIFDTPGTYDYICELHPSMTGTIIVT